MAIMFALEARKRAKLNALAHEKGMTAEEFVRDTIDKILAGIPDQPQTSRKSAYGLWEKYGPGPTEEEIDENRREMLLGLAENRS